MKTKISAHYIIGYRNNSHVIYQNGEMLYENDRILEVGTHVRGSWDNHVDLGDVVVSPGFIDLNALGDIDHELFYCEQPDAEKLYWSPQYLAAGPYEAMTAEEEAFKSLYAYAQLISHGVTTAMPITSVYYKRAGETYEEIEAAAAHARMLGLRVYLGPSYLSAQHVVDPQSGTLAVAPIADEGGQGLAHAQRFVMEYQHGTHAYDDDLIHPVMVPERIELQTEETLRETKRFARQQGVLVRLHAAQGAFEYKYIMDRYGKSTIQYLDSIGFLDEHTLIPHAIYTSGFHGIDDRSNDDLDILRDRGTSVIHCPLVYARGGGRLESFARFRRHGIRLCMGTDTFPPDMLSNIRFGSAMSRSVDGRSRDSDYRAFFEAATLGGAASLGRNDLGRLSPGCKADFIAVRLDDFHIGTIDDPLRTICMTGSGSQIVHSVINGRTVLCNGVIPNFDYDNVRLRAQRYYNKLRMSALDRSPYGPTHGDGTLTADTFYKPSYPIIKH